MYLCCYRAAESSADIPDPPQCEQIVDGTWSEHSEGGHSDQYEPLCQNIPVEAALEATEFTVSAIESENRKASIKRDKSNLEDSVAIEMSAQPLLELTPMTGSTVTTYTMHHKVGFSVSITVPHGVGVLDI